MGRGDVDPKKFQARNVFPRPSVLTVLIPLMGFTQERESLNPPKEEGCEK
jgi:hypothetical protein